jgi:four helix bundle protein
MKYKRFEELPVWQCSADLAVRILTWTNHSVFRGIGGLSNQIHRATLSISNNIAEGFERGTTKELIRFLYYARGSAGEVRSMLNVMLRIPRFQSLEGEIRPLLAECDSISKQIHGWASNLQNSEISGVQFLNERSRKQYANRKKQNAFEQERRKWREELEAKLAREAERRRESLADPQETKADHDEV